VIGQSITVEKYAALEKLYRQAMAFYTENDAEAETLLGIKPKAPKPKTPNNERAALTLVANAILNLDEFVVKS
jgi:hypothetical protein